MREVLLQWDYTLFELINVKGHTALLDVIMPFFRNPYFWAPLYAFIAFFMYKNFGNRGLIWLLFFVLCFMMGDVLSSTFLKPLFSRARPCQDPYWQPTINLLVDCGVGKSFPSSHATNHFALSFFILYTIKKYHSWVTYPVVAWAGLVTYAQVYVGVHYPVDVIGGAILGIGIGIFCAKYFNLRIGL